jgi:SAM-dependent methyltransferase
MDRLKFFALTRRYHVIDNPISETKLERVVGILNLAANAKVLDIASGKGELLCRIAAKYQARCTGVELNPEHCASAEATVQRRGLSEFVEIRNQPGQDFQADAGSYDVAMCVGAEWIFAGWKGTLAHLANWTRDGGIVVAGTPFWATRPSQDYLTLSGISEDDFTSHAGNIAIGEGIGLTPVYSIASNRDDWDHYCGLTWLAAYDYIRENPGDADNGEIAVLTEKDKQQYFRGGRECLSWGIYVFRK